jgi:hypothetical protein
MPDIFYGADISPVTAATAEDRQRSQEFFRYLQMLQQNYQQALSQQQSLGRSFDNVIAGRGPSVAGTQLQEGVGNIRHAVSAQAAGAGGNNAAASNYGAIQALAAAQAKANQDAAMLRAKEVADARTGKAVLLNQEQAATGNLFGPTIGGGTTLSGQSTTSAANQAKLDQEETEARRNLVSNFLGGASSAIAKGASA